MAETFRWGILGTGMITRRVLPGFRAAGHALAIVGSRDRGRGQAAAAELGAERSGSYEDVLSATDVDGIYLALPNAEHEPWSLRAIAAGKPVLCEKPLATDASAAERMVAAAEVAAVPLVEAFMYRYHPRWRVVWRLLEDGAIGELRVVRAAFGFALRREGDVRLSPALGGGGIMDVGCYAVNATRWFLGEPIGLSGAAVDRRGAGVDTQAAAVLRFDGNRLGIVACGLDSTMGQALELIGETGRIEVPLPFLPGADASIQVIDAEGVRTVPVASTNQYAHQFEAFARLVAHGGRSPTPASDAIKNLRVLNAWQASG